MVSYTTIKHYIDQKWNWHEPCKKTGTATHIGKEKQ